MSGGGKNAYLKARDERDMKFFMAGMEQGTVADVYPVKKSQGINCLIHRVHLHNSAKFKVQSYGTVTPYGFRF